MGDDKASPSRPPGSDRELLMASHDEDIEDPPKAGPPPPSAYHQGRVVRILEYLSFSPRFNLNFLYDMVSKIHGCSSHILFVLHFLDT